eukprot:6169285-Pyramimonas_sp.AAC.1
MTSASRFSPNADLALQCPIRNFIRIENVVSVRLAESIHELPPVACAGSCTLVQYDNDVSSGFHCYEAEGTALNIHDIAGSTHSRTIQCLESMKPQVGFDQDMTTFEELADMPAQDEDAREAPEAGTPQEDGRLPTVYEES